MPSVTQVSIQLRDVAVEAARAAGAVHLEHLGAPPTVDRLHAHDIKLAADRLSESAIVEVIRRTFPDHAIHSEECGVLAGSGDHVWWIDPLDGTMNFSQGFHYFCSCVACYRRPSAAPAAACAPAAGTDAASLGEPVVGVVYAPALDDLFVGVRGQGATRNGAPLRVAEVGDLADAVVAVSLGSEEATMARMLEVVSVLLRRCRKLRLLGACGLDIANVAAGRLAGLVQRHVRAWDFAAARVILEEAGGRLLPVSLGKGRWDVLACAPALEAELLEILGDRA